MFPFKYVDGTEPRVHDMVSFFVWDSDDGVTHDFVCILHNTDFVYISGGMDFGTALGKRISFEDAIAYAENNDVGMDGFRKVGQCSQISGIIKRGFNL